MQIPPWTEKSLRSLSAAAEEGRTRTLAGSKDQAKKPIRHDVKGEGDYSLEQILMSWKTL